MDGDSVNGKTRYLLGLAAIAAAYYGTAKLGLELAYGLESDGPAEPPDQGKFKLNVVDS